MTTQARKTWGLLIVESHLSCVSNAEIVLETRIFPSLKCWCIWGDFLYLFISGSFFMLRCCLCCFYSWTVSEAADPIPLNLWSICVYYVCVCMEIDCWEICLQVSLWVSLNCLQLKVLLSTKTAGGGGGAYSLTVLCLLFCKYVYHCWKPTWKKISWCCAISRGLEWGGEIKSSRVPLLCSWIILSICLSCKHHCYCRHSWNCCAAYVEICSNLMRVMRILSRHVNWDKIV